MRGRVEIKRWRVAAFAFPLVPPRVVRRDPPGEVLMLLINMIFSCITIFYHLIKLQDYQIPLNALKLLKGLINH